MTEKEINERLDEHTKAYISFMSDVLEDRKRNSRFKNIIILILIAVIAVIVFMFVKVMINCQDKITYQAEQSEKRMYDFLSQYDFTGDMELESMFNKDNSGNINVTR